MTFSSSMSVVEYYLLNRFPVPYALYFIVVSIIAALIGQQAVDSLIRLTGRKRIHYHLCSSLHDIRQRPFTGRGWHIRHG
ncbi:sulfite exporter TauE/SafE family protein 3-like [Herrania umbratica]|uniref:Sulfite exporter TauE/SafE family protein 3-like n=1 Tax=Herrania umbratica TaxID=108875 RepID=A0A6J0ZS08_9ROSI|nr:sulfite exporter TauE/SafE family protein 3-like [Herrania umbratica]